MSDFDSKIAQLSTLLTNLVADLEAVQTKVTDTASAFDALANQKAQVEGIQTSVSELKSVLKGMDTRFFESLESKAARLNGILRNALSGVGQVGEVIDQLHTQARVMETLVGTQTEYLGQLRATSGAVREFASGNAGLIAQAREIQGALASAAGAASSFNNALDTARFDSVTGQLRELTERITSTAYAFDYMAEAAGRAAAAVRDTPTGGAGGGYDSSGYRQDYERERRYDGGYNRAPEPEPVYRPERQPNVRYTPSVSDYARERQVDIQRVSGTGQRSYVTKSDVDNYLSDFGPDELNLQRALQTGVPKIDAAIRGLEQRIGESANPFRYLAASKIFGKNDLPGPGEDIRDRPVVPFNERDIRQDPVTGTYRTRGNGAVGASPSEAAANREAVRRAVEDSPHGVAILGTAGSMQVGAGVIKTKTETADHIAVAYKDLKTQEIKIFELLTDLTKPVSDPRNTRGAHAIGAPARGSRSFEEVTGTADYLAAVPVMGNDPRMAQAVQGFMYQMAQRTEKDTNTYSAVNDPEVARKIGGIVGETCASTARKALEESGLGKIMAEQVGEFRGQFEKFGNQSGINTTTPVDVIEYFENYIRAEKGLPTTKSDSRLSEVLGSAIQYKKDGTIDHEALSGVLGTAYKTAQERVQNVMGSATELTKGGKVTQFFESIFDKLRNALGSLKTSLGLDKLFEGLFSSAKNDTESNALPVRVLNAGDMADSLSFQKGTGKSELRARMDEISDKYYRPAEFFISQAGAVFNGARDVVKGVENGGPSGFLDSSAGIIKGFNAWANVSNFVREKYDKSVPGMLPQGVGKLFTQNRASAMIDLIEIMVGAKTAIDTGTATRRSRRSSDAKDGGSVGKEQSQGTPENGPSPSAPGRPRPKPRPRPSAPGAAPSEPDSGSMGTAADLGQPVPDESAVATGGKPAPKKRRTTPTSETFRAELDKLRTELEASIRAEILKDLIAALVAHNAANGATVSPPDPSAPTPDADDTLNSQAATRQGLLANQRAEAMLSAAERDKSERLGARLNSFSEGTGLTSSGGVALVDKPTMERILRDVWGFAGDTPAGAAVNTRNSRTGARETVTFVSDTDRTGTTSVAQTLVHELTHDTVNQARLGGASLYNRIGRTAEGDEINNFAAESLERERSKRLMDLHKDQAERASIERAARGMTSDNRAFASSATDVSKLDYYFDPSEIYAYIGEALISGKTEFQQLLRKIYGNDLYNDVVADLQQKLPNVFSDTSLKTLQSRFGDLEKDLTNPAALPAAAPSAQGSSAASTATIGELIRAEIDKWVDKIDGTLAGAPKTKDALSKIFSSFQTGGEDFGLLMQSALGKAVGTLTNMDELAPRVAKLADRGIDARGGRTKKWYEALTDEKFLGPKFVDSAVRALDGDAGARTDITERVAKTTKEVPKLLKQYVENNLKNAEGILEKALLTGTALYSFGSDKLKTGNETVDQILNLGNAKRDKVVERLITPHLVQPEFDIRDEAIRDITGKTGSRVVSLEQQNTFDMVNGLNRISVAAKTANNAFIQLNYTVDAFGRAKIDDSTKTGPLRRFTEEVATQFPRTITDEITYGGMSKLQEMFAQLLSIQDELGEVAYLAKDTGISPQVVKANFLNKSIDTAVGAGQGFDEGIQTNLRNLKVLGSVPDIEKRENLANRLSSMQLGAQTVFGISLDQSLESIPSILSTIQDGMDGITDPTERTTKAIDELMTVMDQMVAVQRVSGAQGDELITIYSRLAASAREYGLSSEELLALSSASSVSIGKGSDETTNILKMLMEGTYTEANAKVFQDAGISTKVLRNGVVENRDFDEILGELFKMSQDETQGTKYRTLLQSIAGPARTSDFAKIVRGYGTNYQPALEATGESQGSFGQSLDARVQNLGAQLNQLSATGTRAMSSLLVGTGIMDKIGTLVAGVADSFSVLSDSIDDSRTGFTGFLSFLNPIISALTGGKSGLIGLTDALGPIIKYMTVGRASVGANPLSFIPKSLGAIETAVRGAQTRLLDMNVETQKGTAAWQRNLRFVSELYKEIRKDSGVALQAVTAETAAASAATGGLVSAQRRVLLTEDEVALQRAPDAAAQDRAALRAAEREARLQQIDKAVPHVDALANAKGVASGQSVLNRTRWMQGAARAGDAIGEMMAPIGFDLVTGGFSKDAQVKVGAGIAGGVIGSLTGPGGAAIGYAIGSAISDWIDLPSDFGTSGREQQSLANAILGIKPEGEKEYTPETTNAAKALVDQKVAEFAKSSLLSLIQGGTYASTGAWNYTGINGGQGIGGSQRRLIDSTVSSQQIKDYQRLVVNGDVNGAADQANAFALTTHHDVGGVYAALAKDQDALNLYMESGVSSLSEFYSAISDAMNNQHGVVYDAMVRIGAEKIDKDKIEQLQKDAEVLTATAEDLLTRIAKSLENATVGLETQLAVPTGLNQYGAFGTEVSTFDQRYSSTFADIRSGKITGKDAEQAMAQYDTGRSSLLQLQPTLQTVMPVAQALGQDTEGLTQRLYGLGAQGQQEFLSRVQPLVEMQQYVQKYEAQMAALNRIRSEAGKNPALLQNAQVKAQYDSLQKTTALERERYGITKEYLATIIAQSGVFKDQIGLLEQQNQTRQLISKGTPAEFSAPSLVDMKGYTAEQISKALADAQAKQGALSKMSPGYRKYFADQQFMMASGNQFKGVRGIDQNFFNEALSAQVAEPIQAPQTVDLSKYSEEETQQIMARARAMQDQAVALAPDLKEKYDDERLLIMKKNNQLLMETGLSQEWLRAAINDNTKSNEGLRGHYNLPSQYRMPTVWDYYNEGGKEAGDKNFVAPGNAGMVPMELATQIAEAIANQGKGKADQLPDLGGVGGPGVTDGRNLTYYTGGTPDVYSEPPPLPVTLPDARPPGGKSTQSSATPLKPSVVPPGTFGPASGLTGGIPGAPPRPLTPDEYLASVEQTLGLSGVLNPKPTPDQFMSGVNQTLGLGDIIPPNPDTTAPSGFRAASLAANEAAQATKDLKGKTSAHSAAMETATTKFGPFAGAMASGAAVIAKSMGALSPDKFNIASIGAATGLALFGRQLSGFNIASLFKPSGIQMTVYVNGKPVTGDTKVLVTNTTGAGGAGAVGTGSGGAGKGGRPLS